MPTKKKKSIESEAVQNQDDRASALQKVRPSLELALLSPYRFPVNTHQLAHAAARYGGMFFVIAGAVFTVFFASNVFGTQSQLALVASSSTQTEQEEAAEDNTVTSSSSMQTTPAASSTQQATSTSETETAASTTVSTNSATTSNATSTSILTASSTDTQTASTTVQEQTDEQQNTELAVLNTQDNNTPEANAENAQPPQQTSPPTPVFGAEYMLYLVVSIAVVAIGLVLILLGIYLKPESVTPPTKTEAQ